MIKLTEKQIEALKSIYPSSEFNTVGKKPWKNTWVWNIKEQLHMGEQRFYVAFDHGYGHIALFEGDNLVDHATSGFIMTPELVVINNNFENTSWIYVNCMETEYFQEIFPYAEEHY